MLQEDPVLFQLYKDLVVSQVISAEEFWANRLSLNAGDNSAAPSKQDVGISAAFLVRSTSNLQDFRANKLRKVRVLLMPFIPIIHGCCTFLVPQHPSVIPSVKEKKKVSC